MIMASRDIKKDTWAVIMMAGMGTRMRSKIPKVLHMIMDQPMGRWVLDACDRAGVKNRVVVIGHGADDAKQAFSGENFRLQMPQKGTGHAVMVGMQGVPKSAKRVLILSGDVPCLSPGTIKNLIGFHIKRKANATVLSFIPPDACAYGRIVRDDEGNFVSIVEKADLGREQKEIEECNSGIYVFDYPALVESLKKLKPNRKSGEYHLPDTLDLILKSGRSVEAGLLHEWPEVMGINNRLELAEAADYLRWRIAEEHMLDGVTIVDPAATWIGPKVKLAKDATILPGSILMGETAVGEGSVVGPYTEMTDVRVGKGSHIRHSVLKECRIDNNVTVGPYAHVRPGTRLRDGSHVGDFVELKKTDFGEGSKAGHLTYLGDAVIGKKVNIGAGTITCNYDGKRKHKTEIEDGAFVGSDSILIAPIKIGRDSYIAAGSTLNKDVPPESLAFGRAHQQNKLGWVSKKKKKP
jgi:bifunctional UDP-N-acetylglucosamine pyrophosphorylase/glucosamine-1-phosphate N-acetyltransferase